MDCLVRIASKMVPDDRRDPVVVDFVPDPASGVPNFSRELSRKAADAFVLGSYVALSNCPAE